MSPEIAEFISHFLVEHNAIELGDSGYWTRDLKSLDLDSLDIAEFSLQLEGRFDVEIDPEKWSEFRSATDVGAYVQSLLR